MLANDDLVTSARNIKREKHVPLSRETRGMIEHLKDVLYGLDIEDVKTGPRRKAEGWKRFSEELKNFARKTQNDGNWEELVTDLEKEAVRLEEEEAAEEKRKKKEEKAKARKMEKEEEAEIRKIEKEERIEAERLRNEKEAETERRMKEKEAEVEKLRREKEIETERLVKQKELDETKEKLLKLEKESAEKEATRQKGIDEAIAKMNRMGMFEFQFPSRGFGGGSRMKSSLVCYECGKPGHSAASCYSRSMNKSNSLYYFEAKDLNFVKKKNFLSTRVGRKDEEPERRVYDEKLLMQVYDEEPEGQVHDEKPVGQMHKDEPERQMHDEKPEGQVHEETPGRSRCEGKMMGEPEIKELMKAYPHAFAWKGNTAKIEYCPIEKCKIKTKKGEKVVKKGQMIPQALRGRTREYLEELEMRGIIQKSESDWRNPVRALEKANGEIRIVSNLMALNDLVEKDPYVLPNIRDVIRALQGSKWFTVVDLKEAFYNIAIEEADKMKTAFEFEDRVYEWNGMVMGFKNAPQILQRVMNKIFEDMNGKGVKVYMDDIVIYTRDKEQHHKLMREVIRRLGTNKMRINPEKIQLCEEEVRLLGVTIDGVKQTPSEIKKNEALEYPRPTKISELRRFLGMVGWFRQFIQNYATKTENLTDGLRLDIPWQWTQAMEDEFNGMMGELRSMKALMLPDYNKEFMLRTDASDRGLGAALLQKDEEGRWRIIQWASRKLTDTERRYGITEKEMYAVFWGIMKFEYELRGRPFQLVTDHKALEEIRRKPYFNNNRVNRWIEKIQEFDFTVTYCKGSELAVPDALSRLYDVDYKRTKPVKAEEEPVKTEEKQVNVEKETKNSGEGTKDVEVKSKKTKEVKQKMQTLKKDGKEYWQFSNGKIVEMPKVELRKQLVVDTHAKLGHRGRDAVHYEMKDKWYWPGMKATIVNVIKECEMCQINNRKKFGGSEFVQTSRPLEKVGLDLIDTIEGGYGLIAVDYFTRMCWGEMMKSKEASEVVKIIRMWLRGMEKLEEIITDNGREFSNREVEKMCKEQGIVHSKVSVESHKSNGRVERMIGTIREGLAKDKKGTMAQRIKRVIAAYNDTYHSGIKCTPREAMESMPETAREENGPDSRYKERFKRGHRDKFEVGQEVRVAKRENLGRDTKGAKGRFMGKAVVLETCRGDSYLIKKDDGKTQKRRHYDLKAVSVC